MSRALLGHLVTLVDLSSSCCSLDQSSKQASSSQYPSSVHALLVLQSIGVNVQLLLPSLNVTVRNFARIVALALALALALGLKHLLQRTFSLSLCVNSSHVGGAQAFIPAASYSPYSSTHSLISLQQHCHSQREQEATIGMI